MNTYARSTHPYTTNRAKMNNSRHKSSKLKVQKEEKKRRKCLLGRSIELSHSIGVPHGHPIPHMSPLMNFPATIPAQTAPSPAPPPPQKHVVSSPSSRPMAHWRQSSTSGHALHRYDHAVSPPPLCRTLRHLRRRPSAGGGAPRTSWCGCVGSPTRRGRWAQRG